MRDESFPPDRRLLTKKDFSKVFEGGRRKARPHFVVYAMVRPDPSLPSRIGFAISRKVGKAHDRNLVRRRLREIFRHHQGEISPPLDIVVVARPGAAQASFEALETELLPILLNWGKSTKRDP